MANAFPNTAAFTGYDAPMRIECDICDLEVIGRLPDELEGRWYRCGPDPQFPPHLGDDVYINGDGMVTMFSFASGQVDLKTRYVQTERWKAERAAGRSLYGKYRNGHTDLPQVRGLSRGTANTTPLWHGGRLLILKEDHVPMELDPVTLATRGAFTWDGRLRSKTVTAHPKIDPATGECLMFGFECEGDGSSAMCFLVADAAGDLVREDWFEPPYVGMVHDFAITTDYVLFPVLPTTMDPERLNAGGDHWKWDGSLPGWMGILPRHGPISGLRWFKLPTCFAFHTVNGFNDGPLVFIDLMVSNRNSFPFIGDITGTPGDPADGIPYATRWSFDMRSTAQDGGFAHKRLVDIPGELPLIDTRRIGRRHRYAYIAMVDPARRMHKEGPSQVGANAIGKLDLDGGPPQIWFGDEETTYQEGHFIARGPGEDEGWYINIADHHDQMRSDLLVFDAAAIGAGPVATVRLPLRLRNAFHTTWVPA